MHPLSRLDDGVFQIFLLCGNVLHYCIAHISLGLKTGSHINMPGVELIACTAYRLEPLVTGSYNNLDGKVIEEGPLQAQVFPTMYCLFSAKISSSLSPPHK